jgi:hypothetical protein
MTWLSDYHIDVSGVEPQSGSFEQLAMPRFDPLYNFAHWLTRNRDEAQDLVQETQFSCLDLNFKASRGSSSFQLGTGRRGNAFCTSQLRLASARDERIGTLVDKRFCRSETNPASPTSNECGFSFKLVRGFLSSYQT